MQGELAEWNSISFLALDSPVITSQPSIWNSRLLVVFEYLTEEPEVVVQTNSVPVNP